MNSSYRCKAIATAILTLFTLANLSAQDNSFVLNKLAAGDGPGGASVTVTESGEAASIIRMASSARRTTSYSGYRIRIYSDNKQDARAGAYGALERFKKLFPDVPVNLVYEQPYYKVTAGYCLTNDEALMLWGRIRQYFQMAFLLPETININSLSDYHTDLDQEAEETVQGN